jgi:hypothetical protein
MKESNIEALTRARAELTNVMVADMSELQQGVTVQISRLLSSLINSLRADE